MKQILIILTLLITTQIAIAGPNYTYTLNPSDTYQNTSQNKQVIMVKEKRDMSKYEQVRDGYYKGLNLINDLYNGYNTIRSYSTMIYY